MGVVPRHDDEIHQRRRIGGTPGAGAADHRDLGHDAGEQDIGVEHLAVTGKRIHALLDARAAGILERHHGNADLECVQHGAGDLLRLHLAEGTGDHAEILAHHCHLRVADIAGAGNHAIGGQGPAGHAEVGGIVRGMQAEFLEAAGDDQFADALARRKLSLGVQGVQLFPADVFAQLRALVA